MRDYLSGYMESGLSRKDERFPLLMSKRFLHSLSLSLYSTMEPTDPFLFSFFFKLWFLFPYRTKKSESKWVVHLQSTFDSLPLSLSPPLSLSKVRVMIARALNSELQLLTASSTRAFLFLFFYGYRQLPFTTVILRI